MGYGYVQPASEYHADCLAGMYTRYGYAAGRLTTSDYWEFYYWLYYQPTSSTHGSGANRAAWFDYGYQQYSLTACNQVFGSSSAQREGQPISTIDRPIT